MSTARKDAGTMLQGKWQWLFILAMAVQIMFAPACQANTFPRPNPLDFGVIAEGSSKDLTLTGNGGIGSVIAFRIESGNINDFTIIEDNYSFVRSTARTAVIRFKATAEGPRQATLRIRHVSFGAVNFDTTEFVTLKGRALDVEVSVDNPVVTPEIPAVPAYFSNALPAPTRATPAIARTAGGVSNVSIQISEGGAAVKSFALTLSVEAVADSGGHTAAGHDEPRPTGTLDRTNLTTDTFGVATANFVAGRVSGEEEIVVKHDNLELGRVRIVVRVNIGLFPLFSVQAPTELTLLTKEQAAGGNSDDHHPVAWRYFGRGTTLSALFAIARHWERLSSVPIVINDISLAWGGLHDLNADWIEPHARHREGREVDISAALTLNRLTARERDNLRDVIIAHGGYVNNEGHWHVTFFGTLADPNGTIPKLSADVNGDGFINQNDLNLIGVCLASRVGNPHYSALADVDKNGRVDIRDQLWVARQIP